MGHEVGMGLTMSVGIQADLTTNDINQPDLTTNDIITLITQQKKKWLISSYPIYNWICFLLNFYKYMISARKV